MVIIRLEYWEGVTKHFIQFTELYKHLKMFVEKENQDFFSSRDEDLLNKARNGQIDIDQLIREAEKHYKEEVLEYAEKIGPTDEDIFAQSFHRWCAIFVEFTESFEKILLNRLVHSPLLPEILVKEKTYAKSISEMITRMDKEIESLNDRQATEMENKIEQLDVSTTSEVNFIIFVTTITFLFNWLYRRTSTICSLNNI